MKYYYINGRGFVTRDEFHAPEPAKAEVRVHGVWYERTTDESKRPVKIVYKLKEVK